MGTITIDTASGGDDLFKVRKFDPIPSDTYTLIVANQLEIVDSESSDNKVVKLELRVADDGPYKGRVVFDNLVIGSTPEARKKNDWKIVQFALSTSLYTKETINELDLSVFKDATLSAKVGIKASKYQGDTKKKNVIRQYLFEGAIEEDK